MLIPLDPPRQAALLAALAASEDAEPLQGGGYAVDLYDLDPPVSLELYPAKDGLDVAAAFVLNYDDGLDGYYLGEKLETADLVLRHIGPWLAGA